MASWHWWLGGGAASQRAVGAELDLVLRRKGAGLEALAAQREAVLGGRYPALADRLRELTALRMQIVQGMLAPAGPQAPEAGRQRLAESQERRVRLEAELARQIPEMDLAAKLRTVDRQVVALALPEGSALVEFVRFHPFDFAAVPARGEGQWQPPRYLAFVLPAGEPDNIHMLDLGEAEPIDAMIATFRAHVTGEAKGERGARPATYGGDLSRTGAAVRTALFDPLLPALNGRSRLYLAPDGELTRLPFEILPAEQGRFLIDGYRISYLGTGRDVLRFGAIASGRAGPPFILGDPDFDLAAGAEGKPEPAPATGALGRRSLDALRRGLKGFERLPGTAQEAKQISDLLGVSPRLAAAALEGPLKACRSPHIFHAATHGFFLPGQARGPGVAWRGPRALGWDVISGELVAGPGLENPLLRSGLVLGGFNTWIQGGTLPAEAEDGALTAEDVSGLDLSDTELAVLSACQTGLGEVRTGEGVLGLRRAFVVAGVKTVIMSLWKVPDEATQELMVDFYQRLLSGEPRFAALRAAQLSLKAKYPDPRIWGAFILEGDPGPLPAPTA
jgi:CHAT domain-containing protein